MGLTNKGKIALALAVILIFTLIWMFYANKKQEEAELEESFSSDYIYAPSTTGVVSSPGAEQSSTTIGLPIGETVTPEVAGSGTVLPTPSVSPRTARTPVSTVDANGLRRYKITVTPAPNAGKLDWTVTNPEIEIIDAKNSPYYNKSACEIAGFKNSWSNMFEKIACDGINFITSSMIEPMAQLACSFYATGLQQNRGDNITHEYKDGACLIIDR